MLDETPEFSYNDTVDDVPISSVIVDSPDWLRNSQECVGVGGIILGLLSYNVDT